MYSWHRPSPRWRADSGLVSFPHVVGAVASWGRLQVHDAGFRAEHACVVTLAYGPETQPDALAVLERIARRYRVDLVPSDELERAASRHGTPLPDDLRPPPVPAADDVADAGMLTPSSGHEVAAGVGIADEVGFVHAPDATPDEVPPAKRDPRLEPKTLLPPGFGYPGVG